MSPRGWSARSWLLLVLLLALALNSSDRLVLGLVLQDIKLDLHLSDTQLGLMTGIAFALFYSVVGLPIARWADRGDRLTILAVTTALWSLAMALSGAVQSFAQLLVVRVCVAVGEAGCIPPAQSLIADHFTRAERPRAVSFFMLGGCLSALIGYLVAGRVAEAYGWRMAFVAVGAPGLALALLARLTLKDPRRRAGPATATEEAAPPLSAALRELWRNRTFVRLTAAVSAIAFFGNGIMQWQPAFFIRSFHLSTGQLGAILAPLYGLAGAVGLLAGGFLASAWAPGDERRQLRALGLVYVLMTLVQAGIYLAPSPVASLTLAGAASVGGGLATGPLFATVQTLVASRLRALAIAVVYLCSNLIGLGFGPLAAGLISDALQPWAHAAALRWSLLILSPGYLCAALALWLASRSVERDIEAG